MKIIWHQLIQPPQSDFARSLPAWALIILAVCAFAGSSGAATVTKNNTFTMQANTTDWSAAPGTTDIGSFTGTIDAAHEAGLTLGGSLSMGELLFNGTLAGPASIGNDGNTLTLNSATAIVASSQNKNVTINCPLTITTAGNNFEAINAGTFTLTLGGYLTGPSNGNVIWRGGTGIFSGGGSYTSLNIQSRASVTAAVKLGANNGVATSATIGLINTASGGTANFDLAGFNQTLIGITNVASALGYITNSVTGTSVLTLTGTSTYGSTLVDSGGANKLALVVNGGTLTLSGANTYSGGTTLTNAGQLNINNARAIGATASTFTITGGTTIDNTSAGAITLTNNNAQNWNGDFTYAGSVPNNLNLGTGAVTLGASRQVTVTAGNLTVGGIVSGSGFGLTKLGAGTLTLINANTYSGATVVSSGTLILNGSLNLASAVSVVGGSATLGGTGSAGAVNVASGGILAAGTGVLTMTNLAFPDSATVNLTPNAATAPIKVTGSNGLNPSGGASTVTLNVGLGFLSAGTFHLIQHSGNIQNSGLSAFVLGTNPGGAFTYTLVDNAGYLDLQVAAAADVWTGAFSTEWSVNTITSPKNWQVSGSPVDYADGQAVIFDDTATGTTVDISAADVNPNGVQFYNSTKSYTLQGSKAITGSSALTIIGTNTVTISNTNSFTGAVTINGGTLSINTIASNSVNSALGAGTSINLGGKLSYTGSMASSDRTVTLTTNSTIEVTNAATILTLAGTVGGSANLTKAGSGTLTLSGTGNYTGNTVISAGTLSIGDPGQLGGGSYAGGINVAGSGAFVYSSTAAQTLLGAITGGGSLSQSGGTLTLSGTNTYGGVTTISAGTLTIDITGRLGNGNYATNIINNSAFVCNSTNLQTLSGIISGTGTVTQSGSGTTTLSGTNTYGGGTILGGNAGSLVAANNSAFGTGAVVFNSGSSGAIRMNNGVIITNGITFNGGGTGAATGAIEPNTSAANATLSGGTITINAETSGGGHFGSPSLTNMLTIADPITSSVNVVWRRGLGTLSGGGSYVNLSLANASGNNSYIKLGANNGISTSASVDVASVSTLDLAGYNQTLVGISNGGTITNSSTITSSMLTLTGDLTFPGKIKDGGSPATLALNISGGAVTLSGTNTYPIFPK